MTESNVFHSQNCRNAENESLIMRKHWNAVASSKPKGKIVPSGLHKVDFTRKTPAL